MHRHEIASFVPRISTDVFEVEEGSLDPALQRMLINRWVTAGNRRAGYCQPTAEGTKTMGGGEAAVCARYRGNHAWEGGRVRGVAA